MQVAQRCIHVPGVPQDQRIDYETQCAELITRIVAELAQFSG